MRSLVQKKRSVSPVDVTVGEGVDNQKAAAAGPAAGTDVTVPPSETGLQRAGTGSVGD